VFTYLERGADLHMAQLMLLLLTASCFSKIYTGFTFLVPAHMGSPGKRPLNVCVCVIMNSNALIITVTFIDLFSCIAASLFNKLTYLLTYLLIHVSRVCAFPWGDL